MSPLSGRQQALLEAMKAAEARGGAVDLDALAAATSYSVASIKTYFSKKLDGVLAFREGDSWRVRGAVRCSDAEFARHMTQKAGASGDALKTEAAWRVVVRKLLYEGKRRNYALGPDEAELALALLPPSKTPASPPLLAPEEPPPAPSHPRGPQPNLFDPS